MEWKTTGSEAWKRREKIAEKFGRKCAACGKEGLVCQEHAFWHIHRLFNELPPSEYRDAQIRDWESRIYHVDHIIPKSRGGSNRMENLQLLCRTCNAKKGNKTMDEFLEAIRQEQEMPRLREKVAELIDADIALIDKVIRLLPKADAYALLSKIEKAVGSDE